MQFKHLLLLLLPLLLLLLSPLLFEHCFRGARISTNYCCSSRSPLALMPCSSRATFQARLYLFARGRRAPHIVMCVCFVFSCRKSFNAHVSVPFHPFAAFDFSPTHLTLPNRNILHTSESFNVSHTSPAPYVHSHLFQ